MALEKKPLPQTELLQLARKHQRRVTALATRIQLSMSRIRPSASVAASSPSNAVIDDIAAMSSTSPSSKQIPRSILQVQDAIQFLITGLEKENNENDTAPKIALLSTLDLGRLKVCFLSFLSASYHCLYAAGMTSILSEESSWIGSSAHPQMTGKTSAATAGITAFSATAGTRNSFIERDHANGRLYYEALHILKAGLEDMMLFIKTEPGAAKLYASLEQALKELKQETDSHHK